MQLSGSSNEHDAEVRYWAVPAVAASALLIDLVTACVCVFAVPLPILPVLGICVPIAAILLSIIPMEKV